MFKPKFFLLAASLFAAVACTSRAPNVSPASIRKARTTAFRARNAMRGQNVQGQQVLAMDAPATGVKNITFHNPKASEFYVNGTTIPEAEFDIGPSWAGLLPISGDANETRKLFFWFFPPGPDGSLDDLIFWTNGGPGCSALEGAFHENGPVVWFPGTAKPRVNEFSWTNLSSVLYVEQPVGTGYSQGTPNDIHDENELAAQIAGFMNQFLEVFSELKGKKLYLAGESYAGMYVPYIANYLYEHPGVLDLDLQGIWVSDGSISTEMVLNEIPAVDFVHSYEKVFNLNQTFMEYLDAQAISCGYAGYVSTYVTFPPRGLLPALPNATDECDLWSQIIEAALLLNSGFNVYHVYDTYPVMWDVIGLPGQPLATQSTPVYFDRSDVKKVLHAPENVTWQLCTDGEVFVGGIDLSLPPAITPVLPNVIEKSQRSVIVNGMADFIVIAEGSRIAIQNMTWGGAQGFQTPIEKDSFILDGMGVLGTSHSERGLTYYEVAGSGHMVPQYAPAAAMRIMQYLMGFNDTISD